MAEGSGPSCLQYLASYSAMDWGAGGPYLFTIMPVLGSRLPWKGFGAFWEKFGHRVPVGWKYRAGVVGLSSRSHGPQATPP